jgi:mono/diheme cytochrome c family protein
MDASRTDTQRAATPPSRPDYWPIHLTAVLLVVCTAVVLGLVLAHDADALPKGAGPIAELELPDEIDPALATSGQESFELLCSACHKIAERYVGPPVLGVTERRSPEWIMNMILAPEIMVWEDDTAYDLMAEYMVAMPNQGLDEAEARAILEYFRLLDREAAGTAGDGDVDDTDASDD